MQYNWLTIKLGDVERKPRFCRPGYETQGKLPKGNNGSMKSHNLIKIVDTKTITKRLDAIPRIQLDPKDGVTLMAKLEHAVIDNLLCDYEGVGPETLQGYLDGGWYLTALPQVINRFRNSRKTLQLYRVFGNDESAWFTERDDDGKFIYSQSNEFINQDSLYRISTISLTDRESERLWLQRDYLTLLQNQCERVEISLKEAAQKYGEISIDEPNENNDATEFEYNDQLGLHKKEKDYA